MENIQQHMDAIHVASQLGRLDFLSALLAVIALLSVLGAFPLFWFLRRRAQETAKEVVESEISLLEEKIEKRAIARMEELLPELIEDYGKFAIDAVSSDVADQIASVQEEAKRPDAED